MKPNEIIECSDSICSDYKCEPSGVDILEDMIKDGFEDNHNYRPICRNFDYNKNYKAWIYEGNEKDKTVGYKYMQLYPYNKVLFKIGDYIHWDYEHVNGKKTYSLDNKKTWTTWILQSLDTQNLFDVKGRMLLCNDFLRWRVGKQRYEMPCCVLDSMKYTTWEYGTNGVPKEQADIVALTQDNDISKEIVVNKRFIIDKRAFIVTQYSGLTYGDCKEIYLKKTPEIYGDDLENGYACNSYSDVEYETNDEFDGIVVSPTIEDILEGETLSISIYKYDNGIQLNDKFIVEGYNVDNNKYSIDTDDNNNFIITNVSKDLEHMLNIKVFNKETSEFVVEYFVWLKGVW